MENIDDPKLMDMDQYFWASEIKEPEAIIAFRDRHKKIAPVPDPITTLCDLAVRDQHNTDDLKVVSNLSSTDLEQLFRTLRELKRRQVIKWCMGLNSINFHDAVLNAIAQTIYVAARQALEAIASDNEINRRRADVYLNPKS